MIGSEVILQLEQADQSDSQNFFQRGERYGILEQKTFSFLWDTNDETDRAAKAVRSHNRTCRGEEHMEYRLLGILILRF